MALGNKIRERFGKKNKTSSKDNKKENDLHKKHVNNVEHTIIKSKKALVKEPNADDVDDYCQDVVDSSTKLDEIKIEYEMTISYLSDIQKIQQLPEENIAEIMQVAENITKLHRERSSCQNSENKLDDVTFRLMEKYESELPGIMRNMQSEEKLNSMIKHDMKHLEGEKASIEYSDEIIANEQQRIRKVTVGFGITVVLATIVVIFLNKQYEYNLDILLGAILLCAVAVIGYCYIKYQQLTAETKMNNIKYNKAISLSNKVKIKYVNNTNTLDYQYQKYNVNNSRELEQLWIKYQQMLKVKSRYRENTTNLNNYLQQLERLLNKYEISDAAIWGKQADILLDKDKMESLSKSIDSRRINLKKQIEIFEDIKMTALRNIAKLISKDVTIKQYIVDKLAESNIEIA